MSITCHIKFPNKANQKTIEKEAFELFDLHVSINDCIVFQEINDTVWLVTRKTFTVLFDGTIEHIDYEVTESKPS
jgi:hypothetical protein